MELTVSLRETKYPIIIERGLIDSLGKRLPFDAGTWRFVLVTDVTVNALYGERVVASLGADCLGRYILAPGEAGKSWAALERMLGYFIEIELARTDIVLALGGGVVGDLAGFAAAIYARGVSFVQIPTTLTAMTDSSIGGKTGVNFLGKNTVGAFHQPIGVFIDPDCLQTLPRREYASGMSEIIKHACIASDGLFNALFEAGELSTDIIVRSIEIKRDIVQRDPLEAGERRKLNFGHTLAHALESELGYERLRHGEAVAIGMMGAANLGEMLGETKPHTAKAIAKLLTRYGLPLEPPEKIALGRTLLADKKRQGGTLHTVILREIGEAALIELPVDEAAALFKRANPWLL